MRLALWNARATTPEGRHSSPGGRIPCEAYSHAGPDGQGHITRLPTRRAVLWVPAPKAREAASRAAAGELVQWWEFFRVAVAHQCVDGLDHALAVRLGEVVAIGAVCRPVGRRRERARRRIEVPPPILPLQH